MANALQELYAQSHGLDANVVEPPPLATTRQDRIESWEQIWRDLKFDEEDPAGSSRLLELAMPLAVSGGEPIEMLTALFEVVANNLDVNSSYEFFLKSLWITAHCNRQKFGGAFDSLPIPERLTPRQAYLIARFWWNLDDYTVEESRRVCQALEGQTFTEIEADQKDSKA